MPWVFFSASALQVVITVPAGFSLVLSDHVLQAVIVETGEPATSTSVNGQQITIGFADVPLTPCTLRIAANDPAVRNSSGGFLIEGDLPLNAPGTRTITAEKNTDGAVVAVVTLHTAPTALTWQLPTDAAEGDEFWLGNQNAGATTAVESPPGNSVGSVNGARLAWWLFQGGTWNKQLQIPV
jgi:hypothetical protein